MRPYGPLDVAGLEQLAANPTTELFEGRMYFNTGSNNALIYKNGAWKTITDEDSTTLTSDGLVFPRDSTTNKDASADMVLFFPEGRINSGHTYTAKTNGFIHSTGSLTVLSGGVLIVETSGTVRVI